MSSWNLSELLLHFSVISQISDHTTHAAARSDLMCKLFQVVHFLAKKKKRKKGERAFGLTSRQLSRQKGAQLMSWHTIVALVVTVASLSRLLPWLVRILQDRAFSS